MSYSNQLPESMPLCAEQAIRDKIAELKAKLPQVPHEPAEPLHAVVSRVYMDGATHTRTVDIANDWKRVGAGIRDAVKQGGEVVLRPLYSGEQPLEVKEYPSTKRIRELEEVVATLTRERDEARATLPGLTDEEAEAIANTFSIETSKYTVFRIWAIAQDRAAHTTPTPGAQP